MKRLFVIGATLAALLTALAGVKLWSLRGELVSQTEAVDTAWLKMSEALDQRLDAITPLEEALHTTDPGATKDFQAAAAARQLLQQANTPGEKIEANRKLDIALAHLLLLAEQHPQLRSGQPFARLSDKLAEAENNLAEQRHRYNELVQQYNKSIELFPNHLAASLFGFRRNEAYFSSARDLLARPAAGKP